MVRVTRTAGTVIAATVLAAMVAGFAPARRPVSIQDMSFAPAVVEAQVGDTVVWTNNDDRDHTVVAADGSFSSGNLRSGEKFEHRFEKPGKFPYACSYHPRMKGVVSVAGGN